MWIELIVFIACLVLSAFFSGSETALLSSSRLKLRRLHDDGDARAGAVLDLVRDPRRMLAGILVGNNLFNTLAAVLLGSYFTSWLGRGKGEVAATLVTVALLVVFSEFLPKTLAAMHPVRWSRRVVRPVQTSLLLLTPLVRPLELLAAPFRKLLGGGQDDLALADVGVAVDAGVESGAVDPAMERVLKGGLSLEWKTASDVLVPRVDVAAVKTDTDYDTCRAAFREEKFSRLLVIGETIDEDEGYVSVKDFLLLEDPSGWTAAKGMRKALRVPGTVKLPELLLRMRRDGIHFAVVKDEYGGTAGIVTLEDVLEELVGEIRDEHDADELPPIRELRDGLWAVRGDVAVRDLEERVGIKLSEEESRTIGGLVPAELGHIPSAGESIERPGFRILVAEMDENRVLEVQIERVEEPEPETE